MTDAKETRAHAFEIKFVVDSQMGERIREWARTFLDADPHGTGPFGDEYRTSTLYSTRPRATSSIDGALMAGPNTAFAGMGTVTWPFSNASFAAQACLSSAARKSRSTNWNDRATSTPRSCRPVHGFIAERKPARSASSAKCRTTAWHAPLTPARDRPALPSTSRSARPLYPAHNSVPIRDKSFSPTDSRIEVQVTCADHLQAAGRGLSLESADGIEVPTRDGRAQWLYVERALLAVCSDDRTAGTCLISRRPSRPTYRSAGRRCSGDSSPRWCLVGSLRRSIDAVVQNPHPRSPSRWSSWQFYCHGDAGDWRQRCPRLQPCRRAVHCPIQDVVRDTQDTAYVIFAVAVGMAVGAHNFWVAIGGIGVVSIAAFAMRRVPALT